MKVTVTATNITKIIMISLPLFDEDGEFYRGVDQRQLFIQKH